MMTWSISKVGVQEQVPLRYMCTGLEQSLNEFLLNHSSNQNANTIFIENFIGTLLDISRHPILKF